MPRRLLVLLVLVTLTFGVLPAAAQGPQPAGTLPSKETRTEPLQLQQVAQRAAQPAPVEKAAPQQGAWALGPAAPFEFTRFDAVFVPGPAPWGNKVYFMGGRSGSATEDPTIWSLDPAVGTYADTGADMVEDISNYTANLVNDDGTGRGPAIYVIGGYNADGGAVNIGTVQRYYPQTNEVEALPAADDWAVLQSGSLVGAMGSTVVDDIIYVFGGWENLVAPYFYGGTWAFDPKQPSGSRWTDLALTLTPARAYIQVAAQNGVIYAMGGIDDYTGGDLVPTTIVEALDTANLAAGWQAVAPLPVASGEGRGFGFDADTLAPAPWDNHIYLAGGGDWSASSAEAMEYVVDTNTWNQAFPDLINARRDHAGAFVPLCTPDPTDGLPGLWVFGGHMTADDPPFGPTEFYPLECAAAACNVLLVDDDWDQYSGEPYNGTGTYYYTSTLEALGYSYSRWDVWTAGDPALADLQPYDVVLWFLGYAWSETVTPTNEADLAAYLDGGGNLILSGEDYLYDQGVSTFGTNYLKIDSISEDVADVDPVGTAGDPIGNGLGPYALTVPTSWPVGGSLYPDYASPLAGASAPFYFQASGEDNSTDFDSGTWKTAFLAWPLEGLADLNDRKEVLGAALDWMCQAGAAQLVLLPPWQQGFADAGTTAYYTVTLGNYIGLEEVFDVTYDSVWPVVGPATVGPVPNGTEVDFVVEVNVPPDAQCLDEDLLTVTAADPSATYTDTAQIRTIAGPAWQEESDTNAEGTHWMAFACSDDYGTTGTCFYAGGLGAGNTVTGHAQAYDIATATWSDLPDMPTPVFGAVGGFVGGKFCVAGGFTTITGDWGGTYALQCYDPGTNAWAAGPDIPGPPEIGGAGGAAGGAVGGMLHVTGGCGTNACASNQHFAYDPGTNAWTALAVIPDYLVFHGAAAGESRLYIGGDYSGNTGFYVYDPGTDTWNARASLSPVAGQKSPVGAVVPGGGVFWWGGDLGAWANVQNSTWYYDPVVNAWVQFTALLNRATTGAGGGLADGRLWNFGGSTGTGPLAPPPHESLLYCIPPSPGAGSLNGHVYDANTGLPLANANLQLYGVTDPNFWEDRYSGPDGAFDWDPLISGTYMLNAMAFGYFNQYDIGPLTVVEGSPTTQDVYLDASWPDLSAGSASVVLPPDSTGTFVVTVANSGTADLYLHASELPADGIYQPEAMPRGVDTQVYQDLAAAPDGQGRFIVYMAAQANLTPAFAIADRSARGQYVLDALRSTAQRSQAGLLADLDKAEASYESRYIVNAIVVQGDRALVDRIAARPEVAFIGPITAYQAPAPVEAGPAPEKTDAVAWGIAKVKADQVWTDFGVTGDGIVVSNIDTGVQYDHPALVAQYRGTLGGGSYDHNYNWWDPYNQSPLEPNDAAGHGSHTMGTMCGSDDPTNPISATNAIGMAPGAQWVACDGFDDNTGYGYDPELLECAEFILAPWDLSGANPDPALRPDVVNNSWGGGQGQWWYNQVIYAWRAAGIFPSFSNGNRGPSCGTAGSPGDQPNSFSSGATDINNDIAGFSSRGPALITGITKPNVAAPGVNICSSVPGNGYDCGYSGTSMAAPHSAGEVALIWSAMPPLRGNVQQTVWLMEQSAFRIDSDQCDPPGTYPNNVFGYGLIDAYAAVDMALNANWDIPWLSVDPFMATVAPGNSLPFTLAFDSAGLTVGECYTGTVKLEFNDPYVTEVLMPVELCIQLGGLYRIYLPVIFNANP